MQKTQSIRRRRIALAFVAVALVAGALIAIPLASAAAVKPSVNVPVGQPDNINVRPIVLRSCATSDASVVHCYLIDDVSSTLRVLCLRPGSATVTMIARKSGQHFDQPVTCTPFTGDFTSIGLPAFVVPLKSCTTSNASVSCFLPNINPSSPARLTFVCRTLVSVPTTFTVRLLDASFTFPVGPCTIGRDHFEETVGKTLAIPLPNHVSIQKWYAGYHAHGCISSDRTIAHCWQHNPDGLSMHCYNVGTVTLTLEGVRGGAIQDSLDCVAPSH